MSNKLWRDAPTSERVKRVALTIAFYAVVAGIIAWALHGNG